MGDPYWSDEKFVNTTDNVFRNTVDNVFFDSSTPNKSGTRPTTRGGTKVICPTTGLGIGVVNQDYARKPYLAKSYDEMMRRSTYRGAYNQVLMRQSEFEKPYLEDDYQEMQHFFPIPPLPPWGEWDWIPPEGTTGGPPGPGPGFPGAPGGLPARVPLDFCSITCWGDHAFYGDDCDEAVGECHLSVSSLGIVGSWVVSGPVNKIDEFSDYIYFSPVKAGESARSIKIYADWDNIPLIDNRKEADFAVVYTDERGNVCKSEFTLSCVEKCDCYTEPAFVYDTNNAETMAADSSLRLYVENGCSPFSWSVSGTGFSFAEGKTDGRSNYLIASASACGIASITVTDDCGIVVTGYVRGTTGTWVLKTSDVCEMSGNGTLTGTSGKNTYFELISGKSKQTQTSRVGSAGEVACTAPAVIAACNGECETREFGCVDCIDNRGGEWEIPVGCPEPQPKYKCNSVYELDYYEWECTP